VIHANINPFGAIFTSDDGRQIHLIPSQQGNPVVPKWAATPAGPSPGANISTPALVAFTTTDLELRYGEVFSDVPLASTFTPPAGFTEVYDVSDATSGMTVAATCVRRQPANPNTTQNIVCSQAGHMFHNGHTVLVRANDSGPAPSVRSFTESFATFNTASMGLSLAKPAGVVAGDLLIAKVTMGNKGGSIPVSWSVPDGWIFLGAVYRETGGVNTLASGIWYKSATASEPATYDVGVNVLGSPIATKRFHLSVTAVQNPGSLVGGSDIRFEPQSRCRVWMSTASYAMPSPGVPFNVPFDTIDLDPGHNYNTGSFSYTVPVTGPYATGFSVHVGLSAFAEIFRANITVNRGGSFFEASGSGQVSSSGLAHLTTNDIVDLQAGDILTVGCIQESGATPRTLDGGSKARHFWYIQRHIST
jgi:hypothetical protein